MNPYSKPASGSYKSILIKGLTQLDCDKEASMIVNGQLKLAITSSMTGNVKTMPQLKTLLISALETDKSDVANYYVHGLNNGELIPALSEGAFTYDEKDLKAVAYVKEQVEKSNNEIINPYFTS